MKKAELEQEIKALKRVLVMLRKHDEELKKDLREARTLLFIALGVLFALFGLLLGVIFSLL